MTHERSAQARWAVIIGNDYYPSDRCLEGAVRDANMVEKHLREGVIPLKATVLTATTPPKPDLHSPVEPPESRSTLGNVVAALRNIITKANRGDLVYFHFSGHGIQSSGEDGSRENTDGELGLALFDEAGCLYLWGSQLARALQKMVEKGCIVMLVLDCCFSGSVDRREARDLGIRYIAYNPTIGKASPRFPDLDGGLRDSQLHGKWLSNPSGFTIFSACGPHETAGEVEIEGQGHNGALTHYLLASLRSLGDRGVIVTNQSLHEHLRTVFHQLRPQQTPMCYGNRDYSFYGNLLPTPEAARIPAYRMGDGRLRLRAGYAHGVCKGDEFSLHSPEVSKSTSITPERQPVMCLVDNVRAFESELVAIDSKYATTHITIGWVAKLRKSKSLQGIGVQLATNIDNIHEWEDAAKDLQYLSLSREDTDQPCDFKVIAKKGEYRVVDNAHDKTPGLPTVPVNSERAINKVLCILQHLAKYKYFEQLDNQYPNPAFQESFSLKARGNVGEDGIYNVTHDSLWVFTAENKSDQALYMTVLDFCPSWKLRNVALHSGDNDYFVVRPQEGRVSGKKTIKLRMKVPEALQAIGEGRCEDTFKVFITNRPTSYPSMILPEMPLEASNLCLHTSHIDGSPTPLSQSTGRDDTADDWITRKFTVQTHTIRSLG
ncbi:caspase domain-containing protein [Hypoxylon sp. FL1150]|nr:caspase domain-containing protein [Hypoxylon sp. FL1150]